MHIDLQYLSIPESPMFNLSNSLLSHDSLLKLIGIIYPELNNDMKSNIVIKIPKILYDDFTLVPNSKYYDEYSKIRKLYGMKYTDMFIEFHYKNMMDDILKLIEYIRKNIYSHDKLIIRFLNTNINSMKNHSMFNHYVDTALSNKYIITDRYTDQDEKYCLVIHKR